MATAIYYREVSSGRVGREYRNSPDLKDVLKAIADFKECLWPGNIRQLEHFIKRFLVYKDLALVLKEFDTGAIGKRSPFYLSFDQDNFSIPLDEQVREFEKLRIQRALDLTKTQKEAANLLKIGSGGTLTEKMKRLKMK